MSLDDTNPDITETLLLFWQHHRDDLLIAQVMNAAIEKEYREVLSRLVFLFISNLTMIGFCGMSLESRSLSLTYIDL